MPLDTGVLRSLTKGTPEDVWPINYPKGCHRNCIRSRCRDRNAPSQVSKRDQRNWRDRPLPVLGRVGSCGGRSATRSREHQNRLIRWWSESYSDKADIDPRWTVATGIAMAVAGSQSARASHCTSASAYASEVPGETTEFAQSARLPQSEPTSEQPRWQCSQATIGAY